MYMQYKDCGLIVDLAEEFIPSLRYSRITENTHMFICSQIEKTISIQGYGKQFSEFTFGLEFQGVMPKVTP